MDWKDWIGKKVFIRTSHEKVYSGIIKDVDCNSLPLVWISIIDKFGNNVQFSASEIVEIKEEQ
jgi:ribosome maturation factor RimP